MAATGPSRAADHDVFDRVSKRRLSATFENFNVHAAVCIAGHQDEARERLVRYCARPSSSPESPAAAPVRPHAEELPSRRVGAGTLPFGVEMPFNVIMLEHWKRLLDGALLALSHRMNWPQLLRRTHAVDVLDCPKCHGKLRVLAAVLDRASVDEVLGRLRFAADAHPRARDPAAATS